MRKKNVISVEKNFWNSRLKDKITRTIYSNCESSEQFFGTECFFNSFLGVSQIQYMLEWLKFKLVIIIEIYKPRGKVRKSHRLLREYGPFTWSGNTNSVTHKNRISIFAQNFPKKFLIPVDVAFLKVFQTKKMHKKPQSSKLSNYLGNIGSCWYFWWGIWSSKAQKLVALSWNPTFT